MRIGWVSLSNQRITNKKDESETHTLHQGIADNFDGNAFACLSAERKKQHNYEKIRGLSRTFCGQWRRKTNISGYFHIHGALPPRMGIIHDCLHILLLFSESCCMFRHRLRRPHSSRQEPIGLRLSQTGEQPLTVDRWMVSFVTVAFPDSMRESTRERPKYKMGPRCWYIAVWQSGRDTGIYRCPSNVSCPIPLRCISRLLKVQTLLLRRFSMPRGEDFPPGHI